MLMTVPGNSATSPPNAQARSRGIHVYLILSFLAQRLAICLYVASRARVLCTVSLSCRYYAANTVSLPREVEQIWGCGGPLNGVCALHHYCTVTRLNPESYRYATPCNSFR